MTDSVEPDTTINLAAFLPCSEANGPGRRAVVWVQGCPLRCEGCFNPEFIPFREGTRVPSDSLFDRICSVKGIEGVTFSGGEPFAQAEALAVMGRRLQDRGMNVVTFSGYSYDYLTGGRLPGADALLSVTDLLIAGPYRTLLPDNTEYSQFPHKSLIFLTPRLRGRISSSEYQCRTLEFQIHPDGSFTMTGFPQTRADSGPATDTQPTFSR